MIRIDAIWLTTEPMGMLTGTERALARVIEVFGSAKPHCLYFRQSPGLPDESAGTQRSGCLACRAASQAPQ